MTGYNYEVFIDHCIHMAENRITDNSHGFLSQVQLLGERLISLSRFLEKDHGVSWGQVPTWDLSAWAQACWPRVGMLCTRGCWKPTPVGQVGAAAMEGSCGELGRQPSRCAHNLHSISWATLVFYVILRFLLCVCASVIPPLPNLTQTLPFRCVEPISLFLFPHSASECMHC